MIRMFICVLHKVKNVNVKVFHIVPRVKETSFLIQYESCECKCRLNENVCNSKQKWNYDECRCKYIELGYWSSG